MDRTWKLRRLDLAVLRRDAAEIASGYANVTVEVDVESADCVTCFFTVPWDEGDDVGDGACVEISVYDMGDGHVLSLEADASDNDAVWDDACQLAEELADRLDAREFEL